MSEHERKIPTPTDVLGNNERSIPKPEDVLKKKVQSAPSLTGSPDLSNGVPGAVLTEELAGSTSGLEASTSVSQGNASELGQLAIQASVPNIPSPPTEGVPVQQFNEQVARQQFVDQDKLVREESIRKTKSILPRWMGMDIDPNTGQLSKTAKGSGLKGFVSTGLTGETVSADFTGQKDIKFGESEPLPIGVADYKYVKSLETSLTDEDNSIINDIGGKFQDEFFKNIDDIDKFEKSAEESMQKIKDMLPDEMSDFRKEALLHGASIRIQDRFEQRKSQLEKDRRMIELEKKTGREVTTDLIIGLENIESHGGEIRFDNLNSEEREEFFQYKIDKIIEREGYIKEGVLIGRIGQEEYDKNLNELADTFYNQYEKQEKLLNSELNELYRSKAPQVEIDKLEDSLEQLRLAEGITDSPLDYLFGNVTGKTNKIYDPSTGTYIAVGESSPEIIEWNNRISEEALELSKTNGVDDLKALQSRYYSEMKYLEALGSKSTGSGRFMNELAKKRDLFAAVSKALDLNKSITSVNRNALDRVGESALEAIGLNVRTNEDYVLDYIEAQENKGGLVTTEERDRAEQRFVDKVGSTVGGSIPVMLEIMFWTAVTEGTGVVGAIERGGAKLANLAFKGSKNQKLVQGVTKLITNATNREIQFQLAGETGGAGESLGGDLASSLGGSLSFLGNSIAGRTLRTFLTQSGRAAGETIEEYSGELWSELMKGEGFAEAMGTVIGDDPFEKLALTYITGAIFAAGKVGTDFKNSKIVKEMEEAIRNSNSESSIVKEAKALEVELNKPQAGKRLEIDFGGEEVTDVKTPVEKKSEVVPVKKIDKADTEYKVGDAFFSEKEIIENLSDPEFAGKVKSGEINLDVTNPSIEVEKALEESGLLEKEVKKEDVEKEITPKEKVDKTPIEGEREVTEPAKEEGVKEVPKQSIKESILTALESDLKEGKIPDESIKVVKEKVEALKSEITTETEARKIENEVFEKEAISRQLDEEKATIKGDEKQHLTEEAAKEEAHQQQLDEEADLKYKEIENSNEGIIAKYLQRVKIGAENIEKETGGKVGVGKDINPKWVKKGAKSIEGIAEEILADELVPPGTDMQTVRNIIIDIIKHGSAKSYLESIGGVKPVKAKTSKAEATKVAPPTKVDKIPETKLKSAADFVRSKKFNDSFKDMSRLSSLPVDILFKQAVNTSLEIVATSLEGASALSEAISKGVANLKQTEWYKQLSDNGKKTAEKIFESNAQEQFNKQAKDFTEDVKEVKEKQESVKTKTTPKTIMGRFIAHGFTEKEAESLAKLSEKRPVNNKDRLKVIDDIESEIGLDKAYELVSDPETSKNFTEETIEYFSFAKADKLKQQSLKAKTKAERTRLMNQEANIINKIAAKAERAGQVTQFRDAIYDRLPDMRTKETVVNTLKKEIASSMNEPSGNIEMTVGEEVENLRSKIEEELRSEIEKEVTALKDQINKLKDKKEGKDRKKKGLTQISEALAEIKKLNNRKGPGAVAGASIIGLSPEMINAIAKLVTGYVNVGIASTSAIINKVFNDLKNSGVVIDKNDLSKIANDNKEFSEKLTEEKKEKAVKEGVSEEKVKSILEDYFINGEATKATLSQHLSETLGLTEKQAIDLAGDLESKITEKVKEVAKKELDKNLKKSEDLNEADKAERKEQQKENIKIINKVSKSVMLGALSDTDFKNAFAEKYGFPEVTADQMALLEDLVNESKRFEKAGQRELHQKTQRRLNTELKMMAPKNAVFYGKLATELAYLNALSGLNTQGNANVGAVSTSTLHLLGKAIEQVLRGRGGAVAYGIRAMTKSVKAASKSAQEARRFNYSRFMDHNAYLEGSTNQEMGFVESEVMKGFGNYIRKIKSTESLSENGKNFLKAIRSTLLQYSRMNFLLNASDAFLTTQFTEFNNAIELYNQETKEAGITGVINNIINRKDLMKTLDEKMGYDKKVEFVKQAKREIEAEKVKIDKEVNDMMLTPSEARREKKRRRDLTISKGYEARRVHELTVEKRDIEIYENAVKTSRDWIMLSDPDGALGALNESFKRAISLDAKKDPSKLRVAGTTLVGLTIMFSRMTAKTANAVLTSIPVIGLIPATIGMTKNKDGKWIGAFKPKHDMLLFKRRVMANMLMTTAGAAIFAEMFNWDDDDEEWKLDPDRLIDMTFGSKGNEQGIKNATWGVGVAYRTSPDDEFSSYRTLKYIPQALPMASIIGSFADRSKGLGTKSQLEEFEEAKKSKTGIISATAISLSLSQMLEGSFNSVGRTVKKISRSKADNFGGKVWEATTDLIMSPVKTITQPNFYRDLINEAGGRGDSKKKYPTDFFGRIKYDYFGLDGNAENKTDIYGYEYKTQGKYSQWASGAMNSNYDKPEWKILLKYPEVSVTPFKAKESVSIFTKSFELSEDIVSEYGDVQKKLFRGGVVKRIDKLNAYSPERLQKALNKIRSESINSAKKVIVLKYKGTDKIKIIN